jgi:hypothetical protein
VLREPREPSGLVRKFDQVKSQALAPERTPDDKQIGA